MSYSNRIKVLEESYRILESQINTLEKQTDPDINKLNSLRENKKHCLEQLKDLRRKEYEYHQELNFDDDR